MRKVELRMNEQFKYDIIKNLVDNHGNRGRFPVSSFPADLKSRIIDSYIMHYGDANFRHFTEIILEEFGISISDTILNNWLREENILSPKARKKTKKNMKKLLDSKLDKTSSEKIRNSIKQAIAIIESNDAHPRRPRCRCAGEMIQMDAG